MKLLKTTITLPENIVHLAKATALQEKKSLSAVIREALEVKVYGKTKTKMNNPLGTLGKYKIGIRKIYGKRSDLY